MFANWHFRCCSFFFLQSRLSFAHRKWKRGSKRLSSNMSGIWWISCLHLKFSRGWFWIDKNAHAVCTHDTFFSSVVCASWSMQTMYCFVLVILFMLWGRYGGNIYIKGYERMSVDSPYSLLESRELLYIGELFSRLKFTSARLGVMLARRFCKVITK